MKKSAQTTSSAPLSVQPHSSSDLHTFFQKFNQFVDAPNAVAKIRELVRYLAVTGKLFDKAVEIGTDGLPNGWHQRQLGEISQFINGDRSKNYPSKSFRVDDGVPFINAGHLSNGDVDLTDMNYITPEHFERLGGGKVEPGDVLYCLRGSLGKCAVVQSIKRGAIASSLVIIRPSQQVASRFIFLFLTSLLGTRMISKYDNGSAQPNLSAANVKKYIVPLPPLAEQHRIVAKVDELMAQCDRLEAQLKERETKKGVLARATLTRFAESTTPENLELLFHDSFAVSPSDLRKTILTLAVQGKLVPQDPSDQPGSELIKEIEAEKKRLIKAGKIKQPKPLPPIKAEEIPYELPKGWKWVRLGNFGITQTGTTPRSNDPENFGDHIPFIGPGNIKNGKIDYTGLGLSEIGLVKGRLISGNSILMVCIGGSIGKHAITDRDITCNQQLNTLTPYQPIPVRFVYWGMATNLFLATILRQAGGSATPIINKQKWSSILLPLPPLAEQHRIVAKVDQLMALVDAMENQITSATNKQTTLLTALMARV